MKNIEKIDKYILDTKKTLEELNNIKIIAKKDGTPFKVLEKNFSNCKIIKNKYTEDKQIILSNGFFINLTHFIENNYFDYQLNKIIDKNRITKEPYLKPYFNLNIEEIKQMIEYHKKQSIEYIKELEEVKKEYIDFTKKLNNKTILEIKSYLKVCKNCTLEYAIKNKIKEELNILL